MGGRRKSGVTEEYEERKLRAFEKPLGNSLP